MDMAVDHAGQHDPAFAIDLIVDAAGSRVTRLYEFANLAIIRNHKPGESFDFAICIDGDTHHIIDQRVSPGWCCKQGGSAGDPGQGKFAKHHFSPFGNRLISALVSFRPPPDA